jgi:lipopolysaccharide/colanic/teichoic acid biosynthesis glycosyltransferase
MLRLLDIILSFVAIVVLSPLFLVVAILLRITGEGEVFYLQSRRGKNDEEFKIFKFATMLKDSPNIGTGTLTVKSDPRILPFGLFLRKSKINELPQLFNILLGQMSVIGPRPQTEQSLEGLDAYSRSLILSALPGLSGIGSIVFCNEESVLEAESALEVYRNSVTPYKAELEKWFIENQSVATYFKLIGLTVFVIARPETTIPWRIFRTLPALPQELRGFFG